MEVQRQVSWTVMERSKKYLFITCMHISDHSPALGGSVGVFPLSKSAGVPPLNMDKNCDSGQTEVRTLREHSLYLRAQRFHLYTWMKIVIWVKQR
jgi:hypothetical protein